MKKNNRSRDNIYEKIDSNKIEVIVHVLDLVKELWIDKFAKYFNKTIFVTFI